MAGCCWLGCVFYCSVHDVGLPAVWLDSILGSYRSFGVPRYRLCLLRQCSRCHDPSSLQSNPIRHRLRYHVGLLKFLRISSPNPDRSYGLKLRIIINRLQILFSSVYLHLNHRPARLCISLLRNKRPLQEEVGPLQRWKYIVCGSIQRGTPFGIKFQQYLGRTSSQEDSICDWPRWRR